MLESSEEVKTRPTFHDFKIAKAEIGNIRILQNNIRQQDRYS